MKLADIKTDIDLQFRNMMIKFIKGFGLKELNGEFHRFYEFVDFRGHSDDQVLKLYGEIQRDTMNKIMWSRNKPLSDVHWSALRSANEIVKDKAMTILLEKKIIL